MKWHSAKHPPKGDYAKVFVIQGDGRCWNTIEKNHPHYGWRDAETKRQENWDDVLIWAHCHEVFDDAKEAIRKEKAA